MKKAIAWFTENHVAANLLMMFLIIGGIFHALSIKIEVFPETELDRVSISVEYPGATPEEVEKSVILPIEEKVAGITGVEEIDSYANEGFGTVTVKAIKGWDVDKLLDDVKAEVGRITTLPKDAEKPIIKRIVARSEVINVAVFGDVPEDVLKKEAEKIKDEITSLPDVTDAELYGVRDSEIHIEVSEENLRKYHLSIPDIVFKVKKFSEDIPAGRLKSKGEEILLRTKGRKYFAKEYKDIPIITLPDGSVVYLKDIAKIKDSFEDSDIRMFFQGKPAAIIQVYRVGDQSALKVAKEVKKYLKDLEKRLPPNLHVLYFNDMSKILKSRMKLLIKNLIIGLILVIILLGLFLNFYLAIWVTSGIIVAFSASFIFLPYFDVSINMISLFAYILVLGIVVDDAIVIGENIYKKQTQGLPPLEASVNGAYEIGRAVVFSVLTTVAAFYPILFLSGHIGKLMRVLPIVVGLVLSFSLIEALFVLPSHLKTGALISRRLEKKAMDKALTWFVDKIYRRIIKKCLEYRFAVLVGSILLLFLTFCLWRGGWIKFTFFPKVEGDIVICSLTLPPGTSVEYTEKLVRKIEKSLYKVEEKIEQEGIQKEPVIRKVFTLVGVQISLRGHTYRTSSFGGNVAQIFVELLESERRKVSTYHIIDLWKRYVGELPGVKSLVFQGELFSMGKAISISFSSENFKELLKVVDMLKKELKKYPGVYNIEDDFVPGKLEFNFRLKRSAHSLGITLEDVGSQLRGIFYGLEVVRFIRGKDEIRVKVMYPEKERNFFSVLDKIRITNSMGERIPLLDVVDIKISRGYSEIIRVDRKRVITVSADVDESKINANELRILLKKKFLSKIKEKFPDVYFRWRGEGERQEKAISDILKGFCFAILFIYILLAVPLKSFFQPFIIMISIPFSVMGAVWGHIIMGYNLSMLSLLGIVGLCGVAVNDSLVLVDALNNLQAQKKDIFNNLVEVGCMRFRAIFLTSITTFAGLTPLIFEKSLQAKFLIPMAISLGFGVMIATGITLILIPCLCLILEDVKKLTHFSPISKAV